MSGLTHTRRWHETGAQVHAMAYTCKRGFPARRSGILGGKSASMRSVTFYNFLLEATLTGSILILLLLLARVTIGKRISRLAVYAAWLLVAVRLLLPFSFPNPLMNELRPRLSGNYAARPIADQIRVRTIDAVYDASVAMAGNDVTELDESRLFQLAVSLEKGLLGNMLLIVYCGGAATTLGVLLSRNLRFRRRLRKARVEMIPMEQLGEYVQRCSALHIRPLPVWRVEGLPWPPAWRG